MRILIAHNRYKFVGGEDSVMRSEAAMLSAAGHDVELFEVNNDAIEGIASKIVAAGSLFHSASSSRNMSAALRSFRPDVLHIHNWFPTLSPSVIAAATELGIPVVQTLHNFRMLCANGILYREGRVCTDCLGKSIPLDSALHGCYLESRIGSALVSAAFSYHRFAHTWNGISTFIALSKFQRELLLRGGIDPERVVVKPNFVAGSSEPGDGQGGYALFVGRLTPEKGIRTVLNAWERNKIAIPLRIMGDGPLADEVRERSSRLPNVEYRGQRSTLEVSAAMAAARCLVFPSEWYEPFGLTIVEAFARGTPVIAADLASIHELIQDGVTGYRFTPGDADDLTAKLLSICPESESYRAMRRQCRRLYEQQYTDTRNYQLLIDIYENAMALSHAYA
jgi:glycosyltransferase involved in cell wall biosynthesis